MARYSFVKLIKISCVFLFPFNGFLHPVIVAGWENYGNSEDEEDWLIKLDWVD
jgi:hypothetical protein